MTLLQKADDGDVRRNIWGWWRSHHPHIFRREHLHGSFFSGVIHTKFGIVDKNLEYTPLPPSKNTFDILLLIARPAAGKSEIIDHLKKTPLAARQARFHIGEFEEIDDFPMLWTWFEEDAILQRMGQPRLHTDAGGNFSGHHLWDVLIERICLAYQKKLRDDPTYHDTTTTVIEFARGSEHGGFARAFEHLSAEVAGRMAILYLDVSWEESLRKNRARFNPDRPDSILEHGLPDSILEKLYRYVDWEEISAADPEFIEIQGVRVPYAVFENADDVTTQRGAALAQRLEATLARLWARYTQRDPSNSPGK